MFDCLTDDLCSPAAALLLVLCGQIFNGWEHYPGLLDPVIIKALEETVSAAVEALSDPENSTIVMTGSGTSGRIAYFVARSFNSILHSIGVKHSVFQYLISGGDTALLESEELPEDDPITGAQQLSALVGSRKRVVLIGITCGLSAPYVAGQLDWAMKRDGAANDSKTVTSTVLMGFNPISLARKAPIEIWAETGRTFFGMYLCTM